MGDPRMGRLPYTKSSMSSLPGAEASILDVLTAWRLVKPVDARTTRSALRLAFPAEAARWDREDFEAFLSEAPIAELIRRLDDQRSGHWTPEHEGLLRRMGLDTHSYMSDYPRSVARMVRFWWARLAKRPQETYQMRSAWQFTGGS